MNKQLDFLDKKRAHQSWWDSWWYSQWISHLVRSVDSWWDHRNLGEIDILEIKHMARMVKLPRMHILWKLIQFHLPNEKNWFRNIESFDRSRRGNRFIGLVFDNMPDVLTFWQLGKANIGPILLCLSKNICLLSMKHHFIFSFFYNKFLNYNSSNIITMLPDACSSKRSISIFIR